MGEAPTRRRWNPSIVVFAAWVVTLVVLGSFPGFAGPSYPFGLVAGVLVGPFGAVWAALRARQKAVRGVDALLCACACGFQSAVAIAIVAAAHGLRTGFCDVVADFSRLALGALVGAFAACFWGVVVTQWVTRRVLIYVLALALPIGGYAVSFGRFYTSPMVFAFDHFAGYFAGTLYDTDLGSLDRLWSYRAGTLGAMVLMASLMVLARVPLLMWWAHKGTIGLGLCGLVLSAGVYLRGPELGHYQTVGSIATALGDELASTRCDILFDAGIGTEAAALLGRECDAHVRELERDLQVDAPARIRVFLFASADQKAGLMGARHVYVAKPWRQEIYINASGFPHPVLRHELAHVVAGAFGVGPFKVAGNAAGLVPDPGRIEGIAVMAAPPEDETLTLAQWSAAMKRLDIMPPLGSLFQLGFFGSNSSSAYTVAGAFMQWIKTQHGISTVKAWYSGASLPALTQTSWLDLEHSFGAFLDQIQVSETELAVARSRFQRPAVLARRCPHQVDGALTAGLSWLGRGNCNKATAEFERVLRMDASALRAEFGRAECAERAKDAASALRLYQGVATSEFAGSEFKTAAFEKAGDVAWRDQNLTLARQLYLDAQQATVDEDNLRQLDIKLAALVSAHDYERKGVEHFFFGPEHNGSFPLYTGNLLGEWMTRDAVGLPSYLLGKQYLAASQWQLASSRLGEALKGNLQPRVRREALRSLLVAGCGANDGATVTRAWGELALDTGLTQAQRDGFWALARRCGAADVQ